MILRAALIFILAAPFLPAHGWSRDWQKYPAVIQLDTGEDVFAVADAHADYDRLAALLTGAKIIAKSPAQPKDVRWIAGNSTVVFTGDFIDKWKHSLDVISLLRALQRSAASAGGHVIILAGNHEIEFLASPDAQKAEAFAAELRGAGLNPADVAACKGDLGEFLCSLPFAARVNDWFFSHAGNTAGRTMKRLISDLEAGVDRDGFATTELIGADSLLRSRLGDTIWFEPHKANAKATLAAYASALGVAHIVQGHHPGRLVFADQTERNAGEMFQRYGLIFLIDTGMSQGVNNSRGAVLRIPRGNTHQAMAICFDGSSAKIWDDKAQADFGKIKPCVGE